MCEFKLEVGKFYQNIDATKFVKVVAVVDENMLPKGASSEDIETVMVVKVNEDCEAVPGRHPILYFSDGKYVSHTLESYSDMVEEKAPARKSIVIAYNFRGNIFTNSYSNIETPIAFKRLSELQVGDNCSDALGRSGSPRELLLIKTIRH